MAAHVVFFFYVIAGYLIKGIALEDVIIGNDVTAGFTLTTDPRAFIFTDIEVPRGMITRISFYSTGINLPIGFQIWNQVNEHEYNIIDQIRYVTSASGPEQITLTDDQRSIFTVNHDSVKLGFTMESRDCPVSYNVMDTHTGALVVTHVFESTTESRLFTAGSSYRFSDNLLMDKTFSIEWTISTGSMSCKNNNGGCDHVCHQGDDDVACSCLHGYARDTDGRTCVDINECTDMTSCPVQTYCINTRGSHVCVPIATQDVGNMYAQPAIREQGKWYMLQSPEVSLGVIVWLSTLTLVVVVMATVLSCKQCRRCRAGNPAITMDTRAASQVNIIQSWEQMNSAYNNPEPMSCASDVNHSYNLEIQETGEMKC